MTAPAAMLAPPPRRPLLRYHGGKWRLAPWLLAQFPSHRIYTEAYGGGASVLLRKPRSYAEVYNDLDDEVVNVFRVLRTDRAELERVLRETPYARAEFELAYEENDDALERARRTVIRSFMGFGSAATTQTHVTGFRAHSHRSGTTPARDWLNYPDNLASLAARLQGVVIECRPAVEVLRAHDTAVTLHYVDPPYVHATRHRQQTASHAAYAFEMTDDQHRELAGVLRALRGMVALSGYPSELYDRELYPDWHRVECRTVKSSNASSAPATEVLWMNAAAVEARRSLFHRDGHQPPLIA